MGKISVCVLLCTIIVHSSLVASESSTSNSASSAAGHSTTTFENAGSSSSNTESPAGSSTTESGAGSTTTTIEHGAGSSTTTVEHGAGSSTTTIESNTGSTTTPAEVASTTPIESDTGSTTTPAEVASTTTIEYSSSAQHSTTTEITTEHNLGTTNSQPSQETSTTVSGTASTATSTPNPTTATPNLCDSDPYSACDGYTGPIECSQEKTGGYSCKCARGYDTHDGQKNCIVASSTYGNLTFTSLNYPLNQTDYDNIASQINALNSGVATYLSCKVNDEATPDTVKPMALADDPMNTTVIVTILLSRIVQDDIKQINTIIQNTAATCGENCFGINSSAVYAGSQDASGPCTTTVKLCEDYPGTMCVDYNGTNNDIQFQCQCMEGASPRSSYIANGGEIFVCNAAPIDNCEPNPCSNGGTCVTTYDSFACKCPWTYMGDKCSNPLPLALTIVSCILGAITLALIAYVVYSLVKSKKTKSSRNMSSDNLWQSGPPHEKHEAGKSYENPEAGHYRNTLLENENRSHF